jgi:Rrf2 family protein
MAHIAAGVEYGLHCLLWLAGAGKNPLSARDLAELQQISPSFLAKIFPKLEKAGIVTAGEGAGGGYRLARPPEEISFLDVVDAIEGDKPLFDCREIRERCAVFGESPPGWATEGVCAIHKVMLQAEQAMRRELAAHTLAEMATALAGKAPPAFNDDVRRWIADRTCGKRAGKTGSPSPD